MKTPPPPFWCLMNCIWHVSAWFYASRCWTMIGLLDNYTCMNSMCTCVLIKWIVSVNFWGENTSVFCLRSSNDFFNYYYSKNKSHVSVKTLIIVCDFHFNRIIFAHFNDECLVTLGSYVMEHLLWVFSVLPYLNDIIDQPTSSTH